MASGIVVFGANGSGKTTLGRELARVLGFQRMDVEDYYFEESEIPYTVSRSKNEVIKLMLADIERYGSFVLSGVTGDYGEKIASMYEFAVFLSAPRHTRLERIKSRNEEKYGKRVAEGGDMYEREQKFMEFARTRDLSIIDDWSKTLACPILRLDGAKAIADNTQFVVEQYKLIASSH